MPKCFVISVRPSRFCLSCRQLSRLRPSPRFSGIPRPTIDLANYIDTTNDALSGVRSASGYIDSQLARMRATAQTAFLVNAIVRCVSRRTSLKEEEA
jgi:hypothetical protein